MKTISISTILAIVILSASCSTWDHFEPNLYYDKIGSYRLSISPCGFTQNVHDRRGNEGYCMRVRVKCSSIEKESLFINVESGYFKSDNRDDVKLHIYKGDRYKLDKPKVEEISDNHYLRLMQGVICPLRKPYQKDDSYIYDTIYLVPGSSINSSDEAGMTFSPMPYGKTEISLTFFDESKVFQKKYTFRASKHYGFTIPAH